MNDLNLTPGASRVKCAKISGDTSGNYHPHGESVIYPTLVRMAQEWNMRHVLIDKQGNFGSIAGLPPAAMRYTEARMSPIAAADARGPRSSTRSTSFRPTTSSGTEPTVLPSKFPNLLVNGANGIAVGMATSIPPHNLGEVCDALVARDRRSRRFDRRTAGNRARPRFSHRRHHLRPQRHSPRLSHRPQHDHGSCPDADRRARQEPLPDRRHRDSLPAGARPRSKSGSPSW